MRRRDLRCRSIPATIPGTAATVSSIIARHPYRRCRGRGQGTPGCEQYSTVLLCGTAATVSSIFAWHPYRHCKWEKEGTPRGHIQGVKITVLFCKYRTGQHTAVYSTVHCSTCYHRTVPYNGILYITVLHYTVLYLVY